MVEREVGLYAYTCIRPEVRLPIDQRILRSDCCQKCLLSLHEIVCAKQNLELTFNTSSVRLLVNY